MLKRNIYNFLFIEKNNKVFISFPPFAQLIIFDNNFIN